MSKSFYLTILNVSKKHHSGEQGFKVFCGAVFMSKHSFVVVCMCVMICFGTREFWGSARKAFVTSCTIFERVSKISIFYLLADAYVQHNPDIPDGSQALIDAFIINRPPLVYEYGIIVAEGDIVGVQGRAEGFGPVTLVIVGTCFMDICHNY